MKTVPDSHVQPEIEPEDTTVPLYVPLVVETSTTSRKIKDFSVQEISPFENVPTYKCALCSKRSQDVKKIEQHLRVEHSTWSGSSMENEAGKNHFESGYKTLTRDQVVDLLTMSMASSHEHTTESKFICFYCEVN